MGGIRAIPGSGSRLLALVLRGLLGRIPLILLVLAGTLLSLRASTTVAELTRERRHAEFYRRADIRFAALRRRISEHIEFVHVIGGIYDASNAVSELEFREFAGPLVRRHEAALAALWIDADDDRRPGPGTLAEPPAGRDLLARIESGASDRVSAALGAARRSGDLAVTAPLRVRLDDRPETLYLVAHPVYRVPGDPTYSLDRESGALQGYVVGILDARVLASGSTSAPAAPGLDVSFADVTDGADPVPILGDPAGSGSGATGPVSSRSIRLGERTGRATCRLAPGGSTGSTTPDAQLVLAGGLLLTGLAAYLLEVLRRTHHMSITARRQEKKLREANEELAREMEERNRTEARYRTLVDDAIFGIFRSRPDGRILDVNPALVQMLGYRDAAEVMELDLGTDVYADPEEREKILSEFERGVSDRSVDLRLKRKDGSTFWARLTGRGLRGPDGAVAIFETMVEDVTEKIQLQDQVERAQRVEAIGRLAGGVAHDFNNLLTVILGHTRALADSEDLPMQVRGKLSEVQNCGERAAELTRQLLAFGRQQVLRPRVVSLNSVVRETEMLLRRLMDASIELEVETNPGLGRIRVDPTQMGQVIMNLALNARDAMPLGGALRLRTANVTIREGERRGGLTEPGRYVLLSVRDTGEGMDPETQKHVFEPFFTTKSGRGGTGLGLATVYGIVKQSGGWIQFETEIRGGTTFEVYFPTVAGEEPAAAEPPAPPPSAGGETVLVAEDEPAVLDLACAALRDRGYRVVSARDGEEALRIFEGRAEEFDAIVTDMIMPRMGGADLVRRVRERRPDIGVLCMSGYSEATVASQGSPLADTRFIEKPFDLDDLARGIRAAIDAVGTAP